MPPLQPHPDRTPVVDLKTGLTRQPWSDWFRDLRSRLEDVAAQVVALIATVAGLQLRGPWTPTIGGTGGQSGQTYAQQDGFYVKVGRLVHVACRVQLSALGTITGVVQIKGLPFQASSSVGYRATGAVAWTTTTTAYVNIVASVNENASVIDLVATAAATTSLTTQSLAQANLANTTRLVVSLVYEANA